MRHPRTGTWAEWPSQSWIGWNVYWSQITGQRLNMGGTSSYLDHSDAVDSTTMETDQTGAVVWDTENYPWGRIWQQTGTRPSGVFAGLDWQVNDPSYPSDTREYDQRLGRWMTPDPLGLAAADPSNPQSWNRYAYVTNNPTSLTDPLGLLGSIMVGVDPAGTFVDPHCAVIVCTTTWAPGELDPRLELALYGIWEVPSVMLHPPLPRPKPGPLSIAANNQPSWLGTFVKSFFTFAGGPGNQPTCAGQALYHMAEDLNPFKPGIEYAAPAARGLAVSRGVAQTEAAVDAYIADRGLTVPLRSSVVRSMITEGAEAAVAAGELADVAVQTAAVDYAALKSTYLTSMEARGGGCSAAFPVF